jgi:hypothetical protein
VFTGAAAAILLTVGLAGLSPASALSLKECSAKYKEAQSGGTAQGIAWNEFRKAECAEPTKAVAIPAAEGATAPEAAAKPAPGSADAAAVFPAALSPKYSAEKPGIARLKTCSDQFSANKATNANGGLRWIQKGGGYWSECAKHLKG